MSDLDTSEATIDEPVKQRSPGSRFAELGDRLARTFGSVDQRDADLTSWESNGDAEDPVPPPISPAPLPPVAEAPAPRFPTARHGYDRAVVDERIAELERELAELRRASANAVATEIERIGEQTAAILQTAHEQAQETTRRGQLQADHVLSAAAANAVAITEDATQQLRQLDSDTDAVWRERGRLIDDVRIIATALVALAEDAAERFPAEPEKVGAPAPAPAPALVDLGGEPTSNGRHHEPELELEPEPEDA
jgi:hypothetical protein